MMKNFKPTANPRLADTSTALLAPRVRYTLLAGGLLGSMLMPACDSPRPEDEYDVTLDALSTTVSFQDGVNSYTGTTDTYLAQAASRSNRGAETTCKADGDDGGGVDMSCLIRFSLTGIPKTATVTAATITLHAVDGSSNTYNVYMLKRAWNEAEATWQQATSAMPWAAAGALDTTDRGAVVGTVTGSGSRVIPLNAAGRAMVESWIQDPAKNAGIIIASTGNSDGIDFASSEHPTISMRPKLTITYTSSGTGKAATPPNLLVAFIGDQGNTGNANAVLKLIKSEGAAATVHNGDFDYADNPASWEDRINSILGPDYPYFAVVGNHDTTAWNGIGGYQSYLNARQARVPAMGCTGDLGVKATCKFQGLTIVESCVGTNELGGHGNCSKDSTEQVSFLQSSLSANGSIWSICLWHKNQHDMQVGGKSDEVGWKAYRACMSAGAIIATGHEHSYARTQTLTDLGNRALNHGRTGELETLNLDLGKTFVFVSGLGGVGIRDYEASKHDDDTWWASYYASNRWLKNDILQAGTASYGALFIRFHVDGNPRKAHAYFKDVNGRIADAFTLFTE